MFIFAIFDKKVSVFKSCFVVESVEDAIRSVYRVANDSRSDLFLFPSDFALYRLGELNINNGHVSGLEPIEFIVEVSSLIKVDKNSES